MASDCLVAVVSADLIPSMSIFPTDMNLSTEISQQAWPLFQNIAH